MSAIFQLPVCLTYWSRKYTTLVDPYVDNSHQVWSCDLVTFTFDLLTLSSWRTWRVTRPTLPQSLKTLSLSVLELWVITFLVGYHWKCVRGHWVCAESRDRWALGRKPLHFLESPIPICLFTIDFHRHHYNTLALPCECVITVPTIIGIWHLHLKTRSSAIAEGRAMRRVNWNLANCHATVQKLLIRQVLTKSMVEVGDLVGGNAW